MADWSKPSLTSNYANFVAEVKDRDVDAAVWFEGSSSTGIPTNSKRFNSTTHAFEKWNGTAWVAMDMTFTFPALTVTGAAAFNGNTTVGDSGSDTLTVNAAATFSGTATFSGNVSVNSALSFAVSPVLTPGVANGVVFLNGGKAISAGSALSFDGSNLGVGTTSLTERLNVTGNIRLTGSQQWLGAGGFGRVWGNPALAIGSATYAGLYGVATTYNAKIVGGVWKSIGGGTAAALTMDEGILSYSVSNSVGGADVDLTWNTRWVVDPAGNFAVGTLPSAWAVVKAFQVSLASLYGNNVSDAGFSQNAYYDGGSFKYISNGNASQVQHVNGEIRFRTAPSGTAGAAISFTTGLTLDLNSNLIGAGTGYWRLPQGTTAQRPAGGSGMIRFNTSLAKYEGHNGAAWSSIGGGATGGGSDDIFYENGQTVSADYSITAGKNAMSAGPITIANGITVTVPSGSTWVIA